MTWLSETERRKSESAITVENLSFYFDAVQRDSLDLGRTSRKSGQVLALRQKLLALPDTEFEAAIKTIEKLVEGVAPTTDQAADVRRNRRDAIELFERTADVASRKAAPEKISRV